MSIFKRFLDDESNTSLITELNVVTEDRIKITLSESTIEKIAETKEQQEALTKINEWVTKLGITLGEGVKIGPWPQSMIFDIKKGDKALFVPNEGFASSYGVRVFDERVYTFEEFKNMVTSKRKSIVTL